MSDVSGTATFKHTLSVLLSGEQMCELSHRVHSMGFRRNTDGYVCISSKALPQCSVSGEPVLTTHDKQFFRPGDVDQVFWQISSGHEELLIVAEGDAFRLEYRGEGDVPISLTNYYCFVSAISIEFNPIGFLYFKLRDWARWVNPVKEVQQQYFNEVMDALIRAEHLDDAYQSLPNSILKALKAAPRPLAFFSWRGLKDIALGVKVEQKFYQMA